MRTILAVKNYIKSQPRMGRKEFIMYNIRIGCPWAAAPCGREQEVLKEHGCKGCPAFNEKEFKRIMDAAAKEEMRRAETMEEWRDSFLPENIFGSVDDI